MMQHTNQPIKVPVSSNSYEETMRSPEVQELLGNYLIPIGVTEDELLLHSLYEIGSMLISGGTGGGKSDFVHGVILALMQQHTPEEWRLLAVDAKQIELTHYNNSPYLLTEGTIVDTANSLKACHWLSTEVARRTHGGGAVGLPRILFVVEEASDLMFTHPQDGSKYLSHIARDGPKVGVYTIMLSSRAQVEVFTDEIRDAFQSRIAFWMHNQPDRSQFFLGMSGAEHLRPRGDMLFSVNRDAELAHLQTLWLEPRYRKECIKNVAEGNRG